MPPGWTPAPTVPWVARPGAMESLGRWAKILGLALLFVGVLVVVVGASYPGNCYTTGANCGPTGSGFPAGMAWSILIGKALVVFGLAGLALGGMMKMRFGAGMPASGRAEEINYIVAVRRHNGLLVLICLILLIVILLTVNAAPPIGFPPAG